MATSLETRVFIAMLAAVAFLPASLSLSPDISHKARASGLGVIAAGSAKIKAGVAS